jgi:hypothetical protein
VISPAGYLRALNEMFSRTATSGLRREPDDPYDPDEDLPWTWIEVDDG